MKSIQTSRISSNNCFCWDEIFQTVTKDDDLWETYIEVPFFLISKGFPISLPLIITEEYPTAWHAHPRTIVFLSLHEINWMFVGNKGCTT